MTNIRPLALAKQIAAVPFHFARHQWAHRKVSKPEKHSFGTHPRQYLMFWLPPANVPRQHSVVVFYHGGGWRLGWPDQFPTVAEWFLRRGFPIAIPSYRLRPHYAYPDMREDINLAMKMTLGLMEDRGLGRKKLLISGMSAGATLAAHLAFNRNELADLGMTSNYFSGFLSFGGPLDLEQMPDVAQVRGFAGGSPGSEAFQSANPTTWLRDDEHLPVLLVHGTRDAIVPFSCSDSFLKKYSGPKTIHTLPGGSHLDSLGFALNDHSTSVVVEKWLESLETLAT